MERGRSKVRGEGNARQGKCPKALPSCFSIESSVSAAESCERHRLFSSHSQRFFIGLFADGIASVFHVSRHAHPGFFSTRCFTSASSAAFASFFRKRHPLLFHGIGHGLSSGHPSCFRFLLAGSTNPDDWPSYDRCAQLFHRDLPPWVDDYHKT